MRYPPARRLDLVEELHGFRVADPYRWLEDAEADETEAWSKAQDELLGEWMDGRAEREAVRERLERLLGAGLVSVPVLRGDRGVLRAAPRRPAAPGAAGAGGRRDRAGPDRPERPVRRRHHHPRRLGAVAGGRAAGLLPVPGRRRGGLAVRHGRGQRRDDRGADRPHPLLPAGLAARRRHLLLRAPAARRRRPRGRGRLPPAGLAPPGRDRPRRRPDGLRRGPGEDRVPLAAGVARRPLAAGRGGGRDGAPQRPVHRRPGRRRDPAADPGGARRRDRRPGRDRRPPVPPHQPGRAPVPDRGRRPDPAGAGGLARPGARVRRRPRGLHPDRRRPGGGVQPPCRRPGGGARPGDRGAAGRGRPAGARVGAGRVRPPRGRRRGLPRLHRLHHPAAGATATRSPGEAWSCGWTPPARSTCWAG